MRVAISTMALASLLYFNAAAEAANSKTVQAPIDSVRVYLDRAVVTRKASLRPFSGKQSLVVKDISIEANLESVQVKVKPPLRLISFTPTTYFKSRRDNLTEKKLVDQFYKSLNRLQTFYRKLHLNEVVLEKVHDYQKYLKEALGRYAVDASPPPAMWQTGVDFVYKQSERRSKQVLETQSKIRQLEKECYDLIRKLSSIKTSDGARATQVEIFVESTTKTENVRPPTVEISYVVNQAFWRPHYDIVRIKEGEVALKFYGSVRQRTGELWQRAAITLATGRPDLGLEPPPVSAYSIRPVRRENKQVVLRTTEEKRDLDRLQRQGQKSSALAADTESLARGLELDFRVKKRRSVKPNNEPHLLLVQAWRLPVNVDLVAYPALRPYVFYRATTTNKTNVPLLEGSAHLFSRSDFLGRSRIDFTPVDAKLTFSLGVAQEMRVYRSSFTPKESKRFLPGSRKERTYQHENRLWNFSRKPKRVTLVETLPVSNIQAVKIALNKETQPEPEIDKQTGRVTWLLDVKPEASTKVDFGYTVEAPANFTLPTQ